MRLHCGREDVLLCVVQNLGRKAQDGKSRDSMDDVCRCEKDCRCECETKALLQRTCGFCTKECFYDKV